MAQNEKTQLSQEYLQYLKNVGAPSINPKLQGTLYPYQGIDITPTSNTYYVDPNEGLQKAYLRETYRTDGDTLVKIQPKNRPGLHAMVNLSGDNSKVARYSKGDKKEEPWSILIDDPKEKEYLINAARQGYLNRNATFYDLVEDAVSKYSSDRTMLDKARKYQIGGSVNTNQSEQISDAKLINIAFNVATDLKKQGLISEVAGEQVFAQAFQQTPEAAKIFEEAAKRQKVPKNQHGGNINKFSQNTYNLSWLGKR